MGYGKLLHITPLLSWIYTPPVAHCFEENRMINFDKNATTQTSKTVWEIMEKYSIEEYGNPSAMYPFAEKSRKAINESKEILANIINCKPSEIYFVPSGSVGDNWIISSVCRRGTVGITSEIEHHAVLNTFKMLSDEQQVHVIYTPVDRNGMVNENNLKTNLPVANLVSIMYVNNEIGVMQNISSIGHMCRQEGVLFHTDAVQAFGKVKIDVDKACIDFLTCSAHKFHGAKGIGFVYIRDKYKELMKPLFYGGMQQDGLIAGTENVPGIVGMAHAAIEAYDNLEENQKTISGIYWYFRSRLKITLPDVVINNPHCTIENCISANFAHYGIHGEELLAYLGERDICASTGSACNTASNEPSHVLRALGLDDDETNSTIRFSIDQDNTFEEVEEVIKVLEEGVELLKDR